MPRRKRIHIPGFLWHITHRCHKKEHLLKFEKDRKTWRDWLFKAKKTLWSQGDYLRGDMQSYPSAGRGTVVKMSFPKACSCCPATQGRRTTSGKIAKVLFGRIVFYTTAIENGVHLLRCMAYIELNMVRAGAVKHPKDWEFCGYNEILDPPGRYRLIDRNALLSCCGITDPDEFRTYYEDLVAYTLQHGSLRRKSLWTNNLAVGSRQYIEQNQDKFGRHYKIKALPAPAFKINQPGQIRVKDDSNFRENAGIEDYVISESQPVYDACFSLENWGLRGENSVFWNDFPLKTDY